jgi:short-subunit dehydrogenase
LLNVVSMYGFFATGRCTAYHVSKYGMLGLSEALRVEYGRRGLGVTALCPGFVRTSLYDNMLLADGHRRSPVPPRWLSTTPDQVAAKAIRAIRRNQRIALVTPLAHLAYHMKRFTPGVMDWLTHLGRRRFMRRKAPTARPFDAEPVLLRHPALDALAYDAVVPEVLRRAA